MSDDEGHAIVPEASEQHGEPRSPAPQDDLYNDDSLPVEHHAHDEGGEEHSQSDYGEEEEAQYANDEDPSQSGDEGDEQVACGDEEPPFQPESPNEEEPQERDEESNEPELQVKSEPLTQEAEYDEDGEGEDNRLTEETEDVEGEREEEGEDDEREDIDEGDGDERHEDVEREERDEGDGDERHEDVEREERDEGDERAERDEGVEREERDEEEDEEDVKVSVKKRIVMSSDEDSDGEPKEKEEGEKDGEEEGEKEGEGDKEVGDLMEKIFGDESDEEKDDEERRKGHGEDEDEERGDRGRERDRDDDDMEPGVEWDFDLMLASKKADKAKKRRRRRDGGIDIINDDDGTIQMLVEQMKAAAKDDRHSNMERKPALKKRRMLTAVRSHLMRLDMMEAMIDGGMMSAISEWLAPLPDKSLPALEIRNELLRILQSYGRLEQSILKQSGLGKAVMLLFKHPRETKDNKKIASKLISEWARPIFQLDTDFRSLSRDERVQRDLEHMPQAKRRRMSQDDGGEGTSRQDSLDETAMPGQKGFIGRARVPKPSTRDYVIRPRSNVDGDFKGASKGKNFARLDKATRDFKERTKKTKAARAISVSIEGRKMDI